MQSVTLTSAIRALAAARRSEQSVLAHGPMPRRPWTLLHPQRRRVSHRLMRSAEQRLRRRGRPQVLLELLAARGEHSSARLQV